MRSLHISCLVATLAVAACTKTSNGDVVVQKPTGVNTTPDTIHMPSIGTKTDTINTPVVGTQPETIIVNKPTVGTKKTIVKTPVIKR